MEGPFRKVSYCKTSPKYIKTERLLQQNPYTHHLHLPWTFYLLYHMSIDLAVHQFLFKSISEWISSMFVYKFLMWNICTTNCIRLSVHLLNFCKWIVHLYKFNPIKIDIAINPESSPLSWFNCPHSMSQHLTQGQVYSKCSINVGWRMNVDMAFSPEGRIMSFFLVLPHRMDAQYSSDCKESACNAGDLG